MCSYIIIALFKLFEKSRTVIQICCSNSCCLNINFLGNNFFLHPFYYHSILRIAHFILHHEVFTTLIQEEYTMILMSIWCYWVHSFFTNCTEIGRLLILLAKWGEFFHNSYIGARDDKRDLNLWKKKTLLMKFLVIKAWSGM